MLELKDRYVLLWWRKAISGKERRPEQRNKGTMLLEVGQS